MTVLELFLFNKNASVFPTLIPFPPCPPPHFQCCTHSVGMVVGCRVLIPQPHISSQRVSRAGTSNDLQPGTEPFVSMFSFSLNELQMEVSDRSDRRLIIHNSDNLLAECCSVYRINIWRIDMNMRFWYFIGPSNIPYQRS